MMIVNKIMFTFIGKKDAAGLSIAHKTFPCHANIETASLIFVFL